jgi:hypothetical protein
MSVVASDTFPECLADTAAWKKGSSEVDGGRWWYTDEHDDSQRGFYLLSPRWRGNYGHYGKWRLVRFGYGTGGSRLFIATETPEQMKAEIAALVLTGEWV